jgi:hypothetical protein
MGDVEHVDRAHVERLVREAFASVEYPGDWALRESAMGDEPFLVEQEFKGRADWRALDAAFLDQAPAGFGSALSFLPDLAFRFYLPAYLIADLGGGLKTVDPLFHLCHGFEDDVMLQTINPRFYGARTWIDHARHRFSTFTTEQAAAIVAYLRHESSDEDRTFLDRHLIDRALTRYWLSRARGLAHDLPQAGVDEAPPVVRITSADEASYLSLTPNDPADRSQGVRMRLRTRVGDCDFLGENPGVHLADMEGFAERLSRFADAGDEGGPIVLEGSEGCRLTFRRYGQNAGVSMEIRVSRLNHGFNPLRARETALATTIDLDTGALADTLKGFVALARP